MTTKKYREKRKLVQDEKGLEKKHYRWIIGLGIMACGYYYFIEPKTIGHDIRYSIFIFWLPTILGMIVLGFYRRQFLLIKFATNKGFTLCFFMICFYLIQGLLFSYLSFGQVAKMSWNIANYKIAKQNSPETIECNVTRFWTKRSPCSIDFNLKNRHESFRVRHQDIQEYENEAPENYKVKLETQEGLWNYHLVNKWTILRK